MKLFIDLRLWHYNLNQASGLNQVQDSSIETPESEDLFSALFLILHEK